MPRDNPRDARSPVGTLAAWIYCQKGFVDIRAAALIAVGFVLGSILGAKFAMGMSSITLERIFGAAIMLIGPKMIIGK